MVWGLGSGAKETNKMMHPVLPLLVGFHGKRQICFPMQMLCGANLLWLFLASHMMTIFTNSNDVGCSKESLIVIDAARWAEVFGRKSASVHPKALFRHPPISHRCQPVLSCLGTLAHLPQPTSFQLLQLCLLSWSPETCLVILEASSRKPCRHPHPPPGIARQTFTSHSGSLHASIRKPPYSSHARRMSATSICTSPSHMSHGSSALPSGRVKPHPASSTLLVPSSLRRLASVASGCSSFLFALGSSVSLTAFSRNSKYC